MQNQLDENETRGMTVNERLYLSGLLEEFDEAVSQRDKAKLKTILEKVHLDSKSIQAIIEEKTKRILN